MQVENAPCVAAKTHFIRASVDHGLNGKHMAWLHDANRLVARIVRHIRSTVFILILFKIEINISHIITRNNTN